MHPTIPALHVRSVVDLLGVVPHLLGFHPTNSFACVILNAAPPPHEHQPDRASRGAAVRGPTAVRVVALARADLPSPAPGDRTAHLAAERELAEQMEQTVRRQCPNPAAVLIGYGPHTAAASLLDTARAVFATAGITAPDAVRVTDGRYFHHGCPHRACAVGVPFDPASTVSAAQATYHGLVALPDRSVLAHQVAPVTGRQAAAMATATSRALDQLAAIADPHQAGIAAVDRAIAGGRRGEQSDDEQAARLTVLLHLVSVRDHALARIDGSGRDIGLWADLTRRARPDLAAPPATLLAYAAWQHGNGALANLALDRAVAAEPGYRMARLLAVALTAGLPPTALHELRRPPSARDGATGGASS